jgi:hypothetical protein
LPDAGASGRSPTALTLLLRLLVVRWPRRACRATATTIPSPRPSTVAEGLT